MLVQRPDGSDPVFGGKVMFRPITPEDKELYYYYVDLFYHSEAVESPVPRSHYDATFGELMRSDDYLKCYIFEDDSKPCGFALLSKTFSQEAGGVSVTIEEIFIDAEYRGRGLATEFFEYLKSLPGIARLRIEVEDDNEGAKRLYERMGFKLLPYLQMIIEE